MRYYSFAGWRPTDKRSRHPTKLTILLMIRIAGGFIASAAARFFNV